MARAKDGTDAQTVDLLRYLLVIELWRAGLSQDEIRKRLGMSMNTLNDMLKGVSKSVKQSQVN
jgi:transposase